MATKTYLGDNPDGSPHFKFDFTGDLNPETHAVLVTGPISGPITLDNGTTYNVTDGAIAVKHEDLDELNAKIAEAHYAAGNIPRPDAA
jgi:hypothetical protein